MDLTAPEIRVIGCLLEKQRTTPDQYPLSLNALRLACNQSTNRDPVVDYDEDVLRDALARLYRRRWTRLASSHGRAAKYRHLLDEALGLDPGETALFCVLALRSAQTPGELKQRTERLHPFAGLDDVIATLDRLIGRDLAENLGRRPGQKEDRYDHTLDSDLDDAPAARLAAATTVLAATQEPAPLPELEAEPLPSPPPPVMPAPVANDDRADRVDAELAALREELDTLKAAVDELRAELGV